MLRARSLLCATVLILGSCGHDAEPSLDRSSRVSVIPSSILANERKAANGADSVRFIVGLPLRNKGGLERLIADVSNPRSTAFRRFLTRAQFVARYAPRASDLEDVASDLSRGGFRITVTDQGVQASGTLAQTRRYFQANLARAPDGAFAPKGTLVYPLALRIHGASIVGLDGVPLFHPFSHEVPVLTRRSPENARSDLGPYLPTDLKQAYQYPSFQSATGKGVTIGVVIDSPVELSDIKTFFRILGIRAPAISNLAVDGGAPFGSVDIEEATLDVEQAGGIAPGARVIVYNIPSLSDNDVYSGYAAALENKAVTLINSSFGGCERGLPPSLFSAFDALFMQGLATGVTYVAASGDNGAYQCGANNALDKIGVIWPADSPYVIAVGGTNLVTNFVSNSRDSSYISESEYKDIEPDSGGRYWASGGGYSSQYKRPSWQKGFVRGDERGLPDLSLHMGGLGFSGTIACRAARCSRNDSSDLEYVQGQEVYVAGTSAAAPDIVGLLALTTEIAKSPLGDWHPSLYQAAKVAGSFHRGIPGNNGLSTSNGRWDPVLGVGTPATAFRLAGATEPAGVPGSPTNP